MNHARLLSSCCVGDNNIVITAWTVLLSGDVVLAGR